MGLTKIEKRNRIKRRINIVGTSEKPRLSVFKSNKEIYAQLIDDSKGVTIAASSTKEKSFSTKGTNVEKALVVGENLAKKALSLNVETCIFDRNGYVYHGRVKGLADGARKGGLKF